MADAAGYDQPIEDDYDEPELPADATVDIDRLSPDDQLSLFSRVPLLPYFVLAIIIHLVLVGATSVGYIIDLIQGEPPESAAPTETAEDEAPASEAGDTPDADASASASDDETPPAQDPVEARADESAYARDITETAEPPEDLDESAGDDLGDILEDID
ncbi:MAG: hypothetical protein ACOCYN_01455 [Planctomycetota bacterium]